MEEIEQLESLMTHSKAYAKNRLDETRLAVAEKSSGLLAFIIERSTLITVFLIALLFSSAAAAIAIGERLGHAWAGFLVVGGVYLMLGFFLLAVRENLIRVPVTNALLRYLFKSNDDEN